MAADTAGEHANGVWIKSEPDEAGAYHLFLELGPDDVLPLSAKDVATWAWQVLTAVAIAEYDAAVLRQLTAFGSKREAATFVLAMRDDRADGQEIDMIEGLCLIPGVSATNWEPFLTLSRHGVDVGQWSRSDAREHVLNVQQALAVTDLDSAYLRVLRSRIGLDEHHAHFLVEHLSEYRVDEL